jgi:ribosomal protein S18 acetylase RimI-like enzyme
MCLDAMFDENSFIWIGEHFKREFIWEWREIGLFSRLFSKRPKTIFVIRKNQLSSIHNLCGIADFYVARKWF